MLFFAQDVFFSFFLFALLDIWGLRDPIFMAKKQEKNKIPFIKGWAGARRARVPNFRVYLQKIREHLDLCAENTRNLRYFQYIWNQLWALNMTRYWR